MPCTNSRKPTLLEAGVLAVSLLLYSNGLVLWELRRGHGQDPERLARALNPTLLRCLLLYARLRPGMWQQTGLRRENLSKSVGWGILAGLGLSVPPLFFFYRPMVLDTPLEFGPVAQMSRRQLFVDLFFRMPVGIALLEELAFRGLLYGILRGAMPVRAASAVSSAAFAGWHMTVTATTAAQTNLGDARLPSFVKPYIRPLSVLGGMISTGIAGAIFAALREKTGNLAGSMAAHWVVNTVMIAALWLGRPRPANLS